MSTRTLQSFRSASILGVASRRVASPTPLQQNQAKQNPALFFLHSTSLQPHCPQRHRSCHSAVESGFAGDLFSCMLENASSAFKPYCKHKIQFGMDVRYQYRNQIRRKKSTYSLLYVYLHKCMPVQNTKVLGLDCVGRPMKSNTNNAVSRLKQCREPNQKVHLAQLSTLLSHQFI